MPTADPRGHRLSATLLATAREVCSLSRLEMAQAAGCDPDLIEAIESLALDPSLDTIERLVNAVGLEARYSPHLGAGLYCNGVPAAEVRRLKAEKAASVAHRASLGLPPAGPLAGTQSPWDGTDPAPPRLHGADYTRIGPGKAAILVRYARSLARCSIASYASRASVDIDYLQAVEAGELRPTASNVDAILKRAGTGLDARLELYDDHDDSLQALAAADPDFYRGHAEPRTLDDAEAERIAAVRRFQADRGKFPGMMEAYQAEKLAVMEADRLAEEAIIQARDSSEPAIAEL